MTEAHKQALREGRRNGAAHRARIKELEQRLDAIDAERTEAFGEPDYLPAVELVADRIRAKLAAIAH